MEETLAIAEKVLKDFSTWPKYWAITYTCESFAIWLMTGVTVSAQSIKAISTIVRFTIGALHSSSVAHSKYKQHSLNEIF